MTEQQKDPILQLRDEIARVEQRRQQVESELRVDLSQARGEVNSLRNALDHVQKIMQEQGTLLAGVNALLKETTAERDELRAVLREQIKELRPLREEASTQRMLAAVWLGYSRQCVELLAAAGLTPPPDPQIPQIHMIEG